VPELRPFRGLRYDPRRVPDLSAVICPPYDVIEPAERARLAERDPRNAVHVELPQVEAPAGGAVRTAADPYAAAAERFAGWLGDGTLIRDDRPLVYPYEQRFVLDDGSAACSRGLFCVLRLEAPGPGSGVRAHEHTRAAAREDRYRLLRAVRANLSPVLLLYEHSASGPDAPAAALERLMLQPPARAATADDGVRHRLWAADPERDGDAAALLQAAASRPLTIADGHHRYATALRFRDEQAGDEAAYVLALLYEARTGGLRIEPTHRVVRGVPEAEALFAGLHDLFVLERHDSADRVLAALQHGGIGLWTRHGGTIGPSARTSA
jgi:uncharacterized protein (DUF1015 family)